MKKKLNRKKFIQLSAFGAVGLYLSACNIKENEEQKNVEEKIKESIQNESKNPSINVTKNDVVFYTKADASYNQLRQGFNKRVQKNPSIIAQCKTENGIIAAIQKAKENKLPISIKSGGHSFEGFSSNNNGLVINLSSMKKIEWLNEHTIRVEPGCTLSDLNDELIPKNKILPAGSCGGVGIGGLTLGGGYGFFSRKYGLTCDSLTELNLIDSNGKIHTIKKDDELMWACKGGGNGNFGVVSSMTFQLYDAPKHFTSHRFRLKNGSVEKIETVLKKWFALTQDLPHSCFSAFVLNGKNLLILLTDFEENISVAQKFKNELLNYTDSQQIGSPKPLKKSLEVFEGIREPILFKNSSAGFYTNFNDIQPFIKEVIQKVADTRGMIYQINTLGGNINKKEFEVASSYPHRKYNYLSELQIYWDNKNDNKNFEAAFEAVQHIFKENNIQTQYRNYPDIYFENWERAYYGNNYERLQVIKQKYDANNLFRYEQSIEGKMKI
ncbi:MAG: FAD-binding protein [Chitinophagales bacterium]|nr:FAD-dependent oxidoreductase [Bacteroidota bacterium]